MNQSKNQKINKPDTPSKIGVDTGGTFTDIVLSTGTSLLTHKVMSTPHNPAHAVIQGVNEICKMYNNGCSDEIEVVHGSTVAINALLERKGAHIALVTTKGFEDILEIGRQERHDLYDIFVQRPIPLVPSNLRFSINERTLHSGKIETEISPEDLTKLALQLDVLDLDAIAICFLFSYANPKNEKVVAEYLSKLNIPISCSYQILPEYREYPRFSTTVANAYIRPTLEKHLLTLKESDRFPRSFRLMLSNGGCVSTKQFESAGIKTVLSGPAGGVIGAYNIAKTSGYNTIITFDMGGTSTDVSLCNNDISLTTESTISGLPIKVPLIDMHTVGAGGGSIAILDSGGALRVGPESAGANPGPICYGQKGKDITVTDANLFLGRISPKQFLGGRMSLASEETNQYIKQFSDKIGISPIETANGILKIANATMERAIKVISVERGFDCRDFTLVCFGGAGGLHAAFLAESLGIQTVLIPPNGGLLSAYGMLFANVIQDYSQTVLMHIDFEIVDNRTAILHKLDTIFDELLLRAQTDMEMEGFTLSQLQIIRSLDVRYRGQSYELNIPYFKQDIEFVTKFHQMHQKRFSYSRPDATLEVVNLRLSAIGENDKPELHAEPLSTPDSSHALTEQKAVIFESEMFETNFYRREELRPGNRIEGPAIITEFSATSVVPPNFTSCVDMYRNIILREK